MRSRQCFHFQGQVLPKTFKAGPLVTTCAEIEILLCYVNPVKPLSVSLSLSLSALGN